MADLEDKILGGPRENYCSDSEGEDDPAFTPAADDAAAAPSSASLSTRQTGPKGVLEDWRRFKQMETERKEEAAGEMAALAARLSSSCRSHREEARAAAVEAKAKDLQEEVLDEDDEFIKAYMAKRLQEMLQAQQQKQLVGKTYGRVFHLSSADEFLKVIDEDSQHTTVLIHIFEEGIEACKDLNEIWAQLAAAYTALKFCTARASDLGTSLAFCLQRRGGLPAVQAYRQGDLLGNFVKLTEELGTDSFDADDVEAFLRDFALLPHLPHLALAQARVREVDKKQRSGHDSDSDLD